MEATNEPRTPQPLVVTSLTHKDLILLYVAHKEELRKLRKLKKPVYLSAAPSGTTWYSAMMPQIIEMEPQAGGVKSYNWLQDHSADVLFFAGDKQESWLKHELSPICLSALMSEGKLDLIAKLDLTDLKNITAKVVYFNLLDSTMLEVKEALV